MTKIYREFFDNGNIKKEIYYDEVTTIVSEWKRYNIDGTLMLRMLGDGTVKLEDTIKTASFIQPSSDPSYIDEDALRTEDNRESLERAREARIEGERRIEERRRQAAEHEARLRAAERFIGRQLGSNDLS
jgi:hypothetical protein